MTTNTDEVTGAGRRRADLITAIQPDAAVTGANAAHAWTTGLSDLAVWIQVHPGVRLMEPGTLNIRVRGRTRGQKISDLEEIAEEWGVPVTERDGTLLMERWFGPARVEAHVSPADRSIAGTAARRASQAGAAA
jgi:hypothetical protein